MNKLIVVIVLSCLTSSCTKPKSNLPFFVVTEGILYSPEIEALCESSRDLLEFEHLPHDWTYRIIDFADKRVMWIYGKGIGEDNDLNQTVELPAYVGSPIGLLRLLVQHASVPIRTYGKRFVSVSPSLELPYAGRDFDSTIHTSARRATIREHIANAILLTYKRLALKITKQKDVFDVRFSGMPELLMPNEKQRKLEGNPMDVAHDIEYYSKYSYDGR